MADYPAFTQIDGSERRILSGERVDRSENGFPRKRVFFAQDYYEFLVKHFLTKSQWESLLDHYQANRKASFTFTWVPDGQDYLVEYAGPPVETVRAGGWRDVEVHLRTI